MKRVNGHYNSAGASTNRRGLKENGVVDFLKKEGFPVTRANYLAWAFMDPKITADTDLGGELEMEIPPDLRHPNHR